jgi:hypothetical protein
MTANRGLISWRTCKCGTEYRGRKETCLACRVEGYQRNTKAVRKPRVRKPFRICATSGCHALAAFRKKRCAECISKLHTSRVSHQRMEVVRAMGRDMAQSVEDIQRQVRAMESEHEFYRRA